MRRRNPYYQPSPYRGNNRLKKYINKSQNGQEMNGECSSPMNGNHAHYNGDESDNSKVNSNKANSYELSIQETNTRSYDDDAQHGHLNGEFSHMKNYDNVNTGNFRDTDNNNGHSSSSSSDTDDEKVEISLSKDARSKDYGFSIADSLYGQGVYVNKVRGGNSFDSLKPYSKIFKVLFQLIFKD